MEINTVGNNNFSINNQNIGSDETIIRIYPWTRLHYDKDGRIAGVYNNCTDIIHLPNDVQLIYNSQGGVSAIIYRLPKNIVEGYGYKSDIYVLFVFLIFILYLLYWFNNRVVCGWYRFDQLSTYQL